MYNIESYTQRFFVYLSRSRMMISPKYDYIMKELFRNQTILKYFISDILRMPVSEIRTVRLTGTFLRRRSRRQKEGILDVLAELDDDTRVNIELQIRTLKHWDRRQLFYLAKVYTEDLLAGEDYSRLKRCVGISLLDFNLSDRSEYHSIYHLKDQAGNVFSDVWELHILELKKQTTGQRPEDKWIQFFNAKEEEDLRMIQTKNPGIQEAIRELRRMNLRNPLRLRYEAYLKRRRDEKAREAYVRDEGIQEGKAEAILELLEESGPVPQELKKRILEESDPDRLSLWLKLAAKADSAEAFREQI